MVPCHCLNRPHKMAQIKVEFFGIPRQRAQVAELTVELTEPSPTLNNLLQQLTEQLPDFARYCVVDNRLADGYVANLDGKEFLSDASTTLPSNCSILIMSADAGG